VIESAFNKLLKLNYNHAEKRFKVAAMILNKCIPKL